MSVAAVAVIGLLVPLAVRLLRLPVPAIVLEILVGVVVGPQVLGLVRMDTALETLATVGLAFLLLLAGLEIDARALRGPLLRRTAGAFALSFALAAAVGAGLWAVDLVRSPLLIAVILSATGLGIVLPVLQDAGQLETGTGRAVVAGASIAEIVPIVLLSLLFSQDAAGVVAQVTLLVAFAGLAAAAVVVILGLERIGHLSMAVLALQDTTAEIRVRGTMALLLVFAALAAGFGLEAILGAFMAGAALALLDRDDHMTHSQFRTKLHAVGFGAFVPFFFVATGLSLDVRGLADDPATLAEIPIFLVALLVVRALPALLYRSLLPAPEQVVAAGLLQATSLSIPIVAGEIGLELGLLRPATYAALVAAGLLSVLLFPPVALRLLSRNSARDDDQRPHTATGR